MCPNYADRWGAYALNYHDQLIHCYQIDINNASRDDMISFIGEVYGMRPEFIWQINGLPRMDKIWRSITTYPEVRSALRRILMQGEKISYNPDQEEIVQLETYGFIKNQNNAVVVANRIFETRFYDMFLSESDL